MENRKMWLNPGGERRSVSRADRIGGRWAIVLCRSEIRWSVLMRCDENAFYGRRREDAEKTQESS